MAPLPPPPPHKRERPPPHQTLHRSPNLYKKWVGSLTPHSIYICKGCEIGPVVYSPYPRRLESLTVCRCLYKGSTFFSVISRPWVLGQPGFEPMASHSADWHLSNWANLAAVNNKNKMIFPYCMPGQRGTFTYSYRVTEWQVHQKSWETVCFNMFFILLFFFVPL